MLAESRRRIEGALGDEALVLDVGGWASPLGRADWVLDLMPYATRGLYGSAEAERFSAETWIERDICGHEPWPFADDQFDFAVCSHTLEDIRDPVWVCAELSRVARAGYVETPSRAEEQSLGIAGPFAGWSHHHWLVSEADGALEFVFKPHALHADPRHHLPAELGAELTAQERVVSLFWEGALPAREHVYVDEDGLHADLEAVVAQWTPVLSERARTPEQPRSARRWAGGWRAARRPTQGDPGR